MQDLEELLKQTFTPTTAQGPAPSASPKSLLEMQNLRAPLELLTQNLHFNTSPGDLYTH